MILLINAGCASTGQRDVYSEYNEQNAKDHSSRNSIAKKVLVTAGFGLIGLAVYEAHLHSKRDK